MLGRPRASADCQLFGKRQNEQKSWRKLDTDQQRGQYYEHCSRSIVPQVLKERQRCLPLLSFSRRDEEIFESTLLGGKRRTNGSNIGEPIRTRKEKLHRDPLPCAMLVFKNSLLGLANFLAGKMLTFCQILIFSYPPFRLV